MTRLLKSLVHDAVAQSQEKSAGVFAGEANENPNERPKKKAKVAAPDTVDIDVDGSKVTCLTPSGKGMIELCVLLDKDMLAVVFDLLHKDIEECFTADKRSYKKKE